MNDEARITEDLQATGRRCPLGLGADCGQFVRQPVSSRGVADRRGSCTPHLRTRYRGRGIPGLKLLAACLVIDRRDVYRDLPPDERARAVFFAPNYGEAAALDIYGPALGGPPAISAHNSYFLWGPRGASGDVVITLGREDARFDRFYDDARAVGRTDTAYAMPFENGLTIWVLRRPRAPLAKVWVSLKHYD